MGPQLFNATVHTCVSATMLPGNPADVNHLPASVIMRELAIFILYSELTPANIYITCSGGEGLPFICHRVYAWHTVISLTYPTYMYQLAAATKKKL